MPVESLRRSRHPARIPFARNVRPALTLIALLATASAACAQPAPAPMGDSPPAQPTAAQPTTPYPDFSYYSVRLDRRRCAAPRCGGYFVQRVGQPATACGDGERREACYVAAIDFSTTVLGKPPGERLATGPDAFLLRGAFDAVEAADGQPVTVLRVSEVLESASGAAGSGAFFRVRSTGVICITQPCLSLLGSVLNSATPPTPLAGVDLSRVPSGSGSSGGEIDRLSAPGGLVLTATETQVTGPAGTAPALEATAAYLPSPAVLARSCGSRGQPACPEGSYCEFPASANCGRADAPGQCTPRPEICTQIFAPVCGCDGRTYPNACRAQAAGVSVASEGACPRSAEE